MRNAPSGDRTIEKDNRKGEKLEKFRFHTWLGVNGKSKAAEKRRIFGEAKIANSLVSLGSVLRQVQFQCRCRSWINPVFIYGF